ncbi:hypothetical protein Tco_1235467 [Tanacetum coccineum]
MEPYIEKAKSGGEYLIRVTFGTALIALILIVFTAIIVIITSSSEKIAAESPKKVVAAAELPESVAAYTELLPPLVAASPEKVDAFAEPLPPIIKDILRNQSDKHIEEHLANENMDDHVANEGGEENVVNGEVVHHDTADDKADRRSSSFVWRFGDLSFAPQWGLTESSRMNTTSNCQDMLSNLFTPTDYEFFNKGVRDHTALQRSWRSLAQCMQTQANMRLRFEALTADYDDLHHVHESCKDDYNGAVNVKKGLQDRIEELEEEKKEWLAVGEKQVQGLKKLEGGLKEFEKDAQQLRKEKEDLVVLYKQGKLIVNPFNLAIASGWMKGLAVGRSEEVVKAIIDGTDGLDRAASSDFMTKYEALFHKRYPYMDKVISAYLRSASDLQKVLPDESPPTLVKGLILLL